MNSRSSLHLAIIPDGNRRWAKSRGLLPWKGHEKAGENFSEIVEWCRRNGRISALTFWCFSTENWKRDKREVSALMKLLESYIRQEAENLRKNGIHIVRSGRRDRIAPELLALLDELDEKTAPGSVFTLHLAIDYGGRDEVVRALRSLPDRSAATEEGIREKLDQPSLPDIDLVLRTGGEKRTSNFALWQTAYAEWIFTDDLFPDIGPEDLAEAVAEYDRRKRRFGA